MNSKATTKTTNSYMKWKVSADFRFVENGQGKLKAFATLDLSLDEARITIRNCKIFDGVNGLFLALPSEKRGDVYYPIVSIEKELSKQISDEVVSQYETKIA